MLVDVFPFTVLNFWDINAVLMDVGLVVGHSFGHLGCRSQNPFDWPIAIHLLDKGAIQIDKMITKKFPLEEWRQAFEAVMGGKEFKVMIESNPGEF